MRKASNVLRLERESYQWSTFGMKRKEQIISVDISDSAVDYHELLASDTFLYPSKNSPVPLFISSPVVIFKPSATINWHRQYFTAVILVDMPKHFQFHLHQDSRTILNRRSGSHLQILFPRMGVRNDLMALALENRR